MRYLLLALALAGSASNAQAQQQEMQEALPADDQAVVVFSPGIDGWTGKRFEISRILLDQESIVPLPEQAQRIQLIPPLEARRIFDFSDVLNVIDLVTLSSEVGALASRFQVKCDNGVPEFCLPAQEISAAEPSLRLREADAECAAAANSLYPVWRRNRNEWSKTGEAEAWESKCLAQIGATAIGQPDGADGGAVSLMASIGVLFVGNTPACSGLLTPDGLFITARHCVGRPPYDHLQVRQASTDAVRGLKRRDNNQAPGVAGDWAVFEVLGGALEGLQDFPMGKARSGDAVYPVGLSLPSVHRLAPFIEMSGAIRTPGDGLCRMIIEFSDCIQMSCQTMAGFSGAPVFLPSPQGGTPSLIGFLSGGDSRNLRCEMDRISRATFAVPNSVVAR